MRLEGDSMKGKKDMKKQQYARAECVVRLVVDALEGAE